MTDVAKLCKSGNIVINGAATNTASNTGNHSTKIPYINSDILPISGVNNVTNNGYLDNRFMAH